MLSEERSSTETASPRWEPKTPGPVTGGQARAIKRAAIFSAGGVKNLANEIHSIAASHPYFMNVRTWESPG